MVKQPPAAVAASSSNDEQSASKPKEEWKRNVWRSKTTSRLISSSHRMVMLRSKEKVNPNTFGVHQALLCFYSPYHDRLLNGGFLEGTSPPAEPLLVEVGSGVLKLFFTWLYNGKINMKSQSLQHIEHDLDSWHQGVTKLYILADSLNCIALARLIISAQADLGDIVWTLPTLETIRLLSGSSLDSSGLYRFYLTVFDAHWNGATHDDKDLAGEPQADPTSEDIMPPNFAYRLLMMRFKGDENDEEADCHCCHDRCKFHGHENDEERKATCGLPAGGEDKDEDEILTFGSESESDSKPESDTELDAESSLRSTTRKRIREKKDREGSKAKRIKTKCSLVSTSKGVELQHKRYSKGRALR